MSPDERRDALRRVLSGDLDGWAGLPEGTEPADLAAVSQGEGPAGQARLSGMATVFRDYAGHPGLLRAFFDDDDHAFLLWADWAPGEDALEQLGEPEAKLEDIQSRRPGAVQWVWGACGVTAYVDGDGDSVRGLALFAPTSAEYYRAALGGTEGVPYRPR